MDFKMPPRQLLQALSSYELGEYMAIYRLRQQEQEQAEQDAARRLAGN